MAPRQNPPSLGADLTPREAALDAIYRFVQSLDFNDEAMCRSAFTEDAVFDLSGAAAAPPGQQSRGRQLRGVGAIAAAVLSGVGPMATAHHVSNPRVRLAEGGRGGFVTAYALAQHFLPGEGVGGGPERRRYLMGNYYAADVVREEGEGEVWRIARFELSTLWSDGDASILQGA